MLNSLFIRCKLKYLILKILSEHPMHGYAIKKQISNMTQGLINPSFGSLYPALNELIKDEYIKMKLKGRKKIYSVNAKGKEYFKGLSKQYNAISKKTELLFSKLDGFGVSSEDKIGIFASHLNLISEMLDENVDEIYKFLINYKEGKVKKKHIEKYKRAFSAMFDVINEINNEIEGRKK